jgi:hypothetical protein
VLLRNDGNGHFGDVSGMAGYDMGLSATWWDYNDDGWLDLYVGNDFKTPDHLYRNNGDGSFTDVLADVIPHTPWFSMGADAADLNEDGILDFLIADMSSTTHYKQKTTMGEMGNSAWFLTTGNPRQFMRNACYLSTGTERYMEVANLTGLDSSDWTWAVKFNDYDNDGLTDVFITNGYGRNTNDSDFKRECTRLKKAEQVEEATRLFRELPALKEKNVAFRNLGNLEFQSVAAQWGLDHNGVSTGSSTMDIDKDGDLDLIVSHLNEPLGVYRNDSTHGNRVLIRLQGTVSNQQRIGSKITVRTDTGLMVRVLTLARGYMSADEPVAHFGLGDSTKINRLTVEWPSGHVASFSDLDANQFYTITEPNTTATPDPPKSLVAENPRFANVTQDLGLDLRHEETPYDDF